MTDFDVALRVRLAYEPAAAKTAVADLDALRQSAGRLGAQTSAIATARPIAGLGQQAQVARASIDDLSRAGARLGDVARDGRALSSDMRGVAGAAATAGAAMRAVPGAGGELVAPAAPERLEDQIAALLGPGAPRPFRPARPTPDPSDEAPPVPSPSRAASPAPVTLRPNPAATEAPIGVFSGDGVQTTSRDAVAERQAVVARAAAAAAPRTISPPAVSAPSTADSYHDAKAEAHIAAMWPSPANPAHPAFARPAAAPGADAGQRAVEGLGRAADRLGADTGAKKLAEGLAAVSAPAVEARRHVDDVADAARHAQRELDRMGHAAGGAGGQGGSEQHAPAGGGARHAGPGGIRGALIAGARPLRMERLVMSAFTPIGMAGLAGGLGLAEVGRQIKSVEEQAASFETAMVAVRRAVGDMPDDGVKRLETTILDASRATGVAKEEVAGLAAQALRAGQPVADLPRLLDFGAKAANVMGVKVEEAGARLIEVRRAWGKDEAGVEDTVNAAALAGQKTGADPAGLVDLANRHADMRVFHMSARQVVGMGAGFQAAGLDPSQAEGAFTNLSNNLLHPENNKKFGDELNLNLGINPNDARKDMRGDATTTMVRVLDGLKKLPEGARANVMERMFGPEAAHDMAEIVNHLDEVKRTLGLVEDEAQRSGAVDKLFKTFDDTATAKVEKAGRSFEGFAARIGARFLPAVKAAADATSKLFDGMSKALDASEQADKIVHKQLDGQPLTPDEQKDVDHNPRVRQMLGMDADPAATAAQTERKRAAAEKTIRDLEKSARENGNDPQIRAMVDQAKQEFRQDFPGAPLPAFASGGRVTGPGGPREDKVHAMLSDGEFVIRASEAAKHHGLLTDINDGRVPRFATGGRVDLLGGALGPDAAGESMPARALARGVERAGDPDRLASAIAKLSPAGRDGKALTADQVKEAIAAGSKEGIKAGLREAMDLRGSDRKSLLPISGGDNDGDEAGGAEGGGSGTSGRGGGGGTPGRGGGDGGRGGGGGGGAPGRGGAGGTPGRGGGGGTPRRGAGHPPAGHPGHGAPGPHDGEPRPGGGRDPGRHPGRGVPEGRERPDAGPPPGDGSAADWTAAILRPKETFKSKAYWDVNHFRLGYGSDTITHADGSVSEVHRGDSVSKEDAERDLKRRVGEFQSKLRKEVGPENWDRLDPATQGALGSVGYNYGGFSKLKSLKAAIASGDKHRIADAVRGLQGHNGGINRKRRIEEASIIDSGHLPESWHARDPAPRAVARDAPGPHPAAPGQPPAPPPVAAALPPRPRRHAAADPAAPAPVRMATGGRVVGPGGPREDRVPAMLSHGEFVITAAAAAKHPGLLDDINGDRVSARSARPAASSARFADPAERPSAPRVADTGAGPAGNSSDGAAPAAGPPSVQNFYGMHDPAVTARRSMMEHNREVRRAQARALHSVGRVA